MEMSGTSVVCTSTPRKPPPKGESQIVEPVEGAMSLRRFGLACDRVETRRAEEAEEEEAEASKKFDSVSFEVEALEEAPGESAGREFAPAPYRSSSSGESAWVAL